MKNFYISIYYLTSYILTKRFFKKLLTPEKPLKNLERKNNQILTPKK